MNRAVCTGAPRAVMLKIFPDRQPLYASYHAEFKAQALRKRGRAVEQEPLDSAAEPVVTAEINDDQERSQSAPSGKGAEAAALAYERAAQNPAIEQFLGEQYRIINGKLIGKLSKELRYDDACEVAAETWKKACRSIHRFDPNLGPFQPWLWKIAKNCLKDHRKKLHKRLKNELGNDISELWDEIPREGIFHYSPNPETIAVRRDLEASVEEVGAYLGLDSTQQEMLALLLCRTEDRQSAVSARDRKRHERLRAKIEKLIGLDVNEVEAVRLVRSAGGYQEVLTKGHTIDQARFQVSYRRACEKLLKLLTKEI